MYFSISGLLEKIDKEVQRINRKVTDPFFWHYVVMEVTAGSSVFSITLERHVKPVPIWEWKFWGTIGLIEPRSGWYVHNFVSGTVHLGHIATGAVMRLDGVYVAGHTGVGRKGSGEKLSSKGTLPPGPVSWEVKYVGGVPL